MNRSQIKIRIPPTLAEIDDVISRKRRNYAANVVFRITKTSIILSHVKRCIETYIGPVINR